MLVFHNAPTSKRHCNIQGVTDILASKINTVFTPKHNRFVQCQLSLTCFWLGNKLPCALQKQFMTTVISFLCNRLMKYATPWFIRNIATVNVWHAHKNLTMNNNFISRRVQRYSGHFGLFFYLTINSAIRTKTVILWDTVSCGPSDIDRRFAVTFCLHHKSNLKRRSMYSILQRGRFQKKVAFILAETGWNSLIMVITLQFLLPPVTSTLSGSNIFLRRKDKVPLVIIPRVSG